MADKYLVEGYEFDSLEMANEAKKELEAVKFMSMKTSGCSPEMALKVYSKIVDNNLFKTEIGLDYLRALEEYLMANGMFDIEQSIDKKNEYSQDEKEEEGLSGKLSEEPGDNDDATKEILVNQEEKPQKKSLFGKKDEKKEKSVNVLPDNEVSKRLKLSMALNIILIIVVIIMFYIASTSSNPTIINYENAIIDKYSSWDEELKEKDKELKAKERELKSKESELKSIESELNIRENEISSKEEDLGIK